MSEAFIPEELYETRKTEIREALERLERSSSFMSSESLKRLLRYLVDEELGGRGDRLTPYSVGIDALGLTEKFDPSSDSRLRVEMKRLRDTLVFHYRTDGKSDPVHITIEPRQYRPRFLAARAPQPAKASRFRRSVRKTFALFVTPVFAISLITLFIDGVGPAESARQPSQSIAETAKRPQLIRILMDDWPENEVANALTGDLARALNGFSRSKVSYRGLEQDNLGPAMPEDYRLQIVPENNATLDQPGRSISIRVLHLKTNDFIDAISVSGEKLFASRESRQAALYKVAAALLKRGGSIEADYFRRNDLSPTLRCIALLDRYSGDQTDANHLAARDCAERLIDEGVQNAELYVALATLYREEGSDLRNTLPGDPFTRALSAAEKSIAIDPDIPDAFFIQASIHSVTGNRPAMRRAAELVLRRSPYEARLVAGIGYLMAIAGDFNRAIELLERGEELTAEAPEWRTYAFFLAHLGRNEVEAAISRGMTLSGSNNPLSMATSAISHWELGEVDEAMNEVERLVMATGLEPAKLEQMYKRRNYAPELTDELVSRLHTIVDSTR